MKRILVILLLFVLSAAAQAACVLVPFKVSADASGTYAAYLRPVSQCTNVAYLASGVAQDYTTPTGANWVLFSQNCPALYAKRGGTAAVPSGNVTDGTGSTLNPSGFWGINATVLGLVASTNCIVTLDYYQ